SVRPGGRPEGAPPGWRRRKTNGDGESQAGEVQPRPPCPGNKSALSPVLPELPPDAGSAPVQLCLIEYFMSLTLHSITPSVYSLIERRIAVVDGHPVIQMAIERALRKAGATTVAVSDNGLEGAVLGIGLDYESSLAPLALELFRRGIPFLFY